MGAGNCLKILFLVYLVNQNKVAGSAECTSRNSIPANPISFNADPSQMANVASKSSPQVSSPFQQNKRPAQAFIPSEQINFTESPQNSKNNAASTKLKLKNSSQASASKSSLVSSPASQSISAYLRSISSKDTTASESASVISTALRSLNRAEEGSFKFPGQLTLSPSGQNTAKSGNPAILKMGNDINSQNTGFSNIDACFNANRPTGFASANAMNSESLQTQTGLNTVISSAGQPSNCAQSGLKSSQNSPNTGKPLTIRIVNNNFNISSSQNSGISNTNGPTKIVPGNFRNPLSSTGQSGLNTIISSAPQSLNSPQGSVTPGQNTEKTSKSSSNNITHGSFNIISARNPEVTNLFFANAGNFNSGNSASLQSVNFSPASEKSSVLFKASSLNAFAETTCTPATINSLSKNLNNAPTQYQDNFITNTRVQKAEAPNFIHTSTPTSFNYADSSASQASVRNFNVNSNPSLSQGQYVTCAPRLNPSSCSFTNANSNIFSPKTLSISQVSNPLPNIESIPLAKPCTSSSSSMLKFSPVSSLINFPQNNVNSPSVSSSNSIPKLAEKLLPPTINNCIVSSIDTIPKADSSEKAASQKTDPSRVLMEKLKAKIALKSPIKSNTGPTLLNMQNEGIHLSPTQPIYIPGTDNSNIPSKSLNSNQPPSCTLASNSQSNVPHIVNLISPASTPVTPISSSVPATNSQYSPGSQSNLPVPINLLSLNFGTSSGDAMSSNSLSQRPSYTMSNLLNDVRSLDNSKALSSLFTENYNKPSIFSNNLNSQQSSSRSSQSKIPQRVNDLNPPRLVPSSAFAPSVNSQNTPLSNNLQLSSSQQQDMTSKLPSSYNLSSNSPLSLCLCQNIPREGSNLGLSQNFNTPNNDIPLKLCNSFNMQQTPSSNLKSQVPHTLNIVSSNNPNTASSISAPAPLQNSVSVCSSQLNSPVTSNVLPLNCIQNFGGTTSLSSGNTLPNSPLPSCPCQNFPCECTNLGLSQPCAENNSFTTQQTSRNFKSQVPHTLNFVSSKSPNIASSISAPTPSQNLVSSRSSQLNNPVASNILPLNFIQNIGGTTSLSSGNALPNSPSSSCLCQNIPSEGTNLGISQPLNIPCAENNNIPLLSRNSFNTQQTSSRNLKSQVPHTINIVSSNRPNIASSISAPTPSQNSVSVCSSQPNTPITSNVLTLNFIQNFGETTLSSGNALPSNMDTSKLNLATNAASVSVSNNGFNAFNQPSSFSAVPVTYNQVSTSRPNNIIPALSGLNTFDSVSNPKFEYSGSIPIVSNPFTCNLATPFTASIPNALPPVNLSPLETTETVSSSPCVVPINYITSHISSPVLDSYNAWVPSLVESLLTAFKPETLLQALLQDSQYEIPPSVSQIFSSGNEIDPQILESLLQDSQSGYSSLINPILCSNDFNTQTIQSLLQDPQCDLSSQFYSQNPPFVIDNEPIVLDSLPTQPQFAELLSDYSISPNYEQLDLSDYVDADLPIVLPTSAVTNTCCSSDCDSSSYIGPLAPQIIIDDNGSIDSSSAEEFIKWTILTELCKRCNGLDPLLALALGSYL